MTKCARFVAIAMFLMCATGILSAARPDAVNPTIPKERGIYLAKEGSSLTALIQARITGMKTAGGMKAAFTYGAAKVKMKYTVRGDKADIRTGEQPVFYISGVEPADLLVLKLEGKGKEREFITGSFGGFGGGMKAAEGAAEFKAEKCDGGYKLSFPVALKAGEYGFAYMPGGGITAGSMLFDFGVDAAQ